MSDRNLAVPDILEAVNGSPQRLGVIASDDGTATTNQTTGTAFDLVAGQRLVLILTAGTGTVVVTGSPLTKNGEAVDADTALDFELAVGVPTAWTLKNWQSTLSIASDAGFSVKVLSLG